MVDLQREMEKLAVDRLATSMRRLHAAIDSIRAVKMHPSMDIETKILDILPPVADTTHSTISDRLLALVNALSEAIEDAEALESTRSPPVNLQKPRAPLCLLSLRDYTGVQAAMELILVWGAYPCVEHGVLTPIPQRVVAKTFKIDQAMVQHVATAASSPINPPSQLDNVLKSLLRILLLSQFKPMLLPAYLSDLLVCLIVRIHCMPDSPPGAAAALLQHLLDAVPIRVIMASLRGVLATPHDNAVFKAQCGRLLSQCVLKDGGVLATIEMLLSTVDEGNTQARLQVAALIARCPRALTTTEYFHAIAPQVRWLLTHPTTKLLREVAGLITSQLILDHPIDVVDACILRPLFLPLLRFVLESEDSSDPSDDTAMSFVSTEAEIEACVAAMKCMVLGPVPPTPVLDALLPLFRPLVYLDAFARTSKSYLHADTQRLLLLFTQQHPAAATHIASCVLTTAPPRHVVRASLWCTKQPAPSTSHGLVFCAGGSGGVGLRRGQDENVIDHVIDAIVDLLGHPDLDESNVVVGELFSHLLTTYMHVRTTPPSEGLDKLDVDTGSMRLLLQITESLGPAVLRSGVVILQTLVTVLSMYIDADISGDDAENLDVLSVGLSMATTIVQAGASARTPDEEALLTKMLVPLEQLAAHPNAPIAEMASDLSLHILSRSAAPDDGAQSAVVTFDDMMARSNADLQSTQVPLRARGLARLTKWIRRRKPVNNVDALVQLCIHHLTDADSYVYLAAVQALAGLGDVFADKTIPLLLDAVQDVKVSIEQRIKVGEALVFTARRCGAMMPKYGRAFVHGYLGCIRRHPQATKMQDSLEEATFRASCLSNLAEVCGLLQWAIHPYITDVVACVRGILDTERLTTDAHIALRRGAVFVLYHMLQLFGRDILEAIPDAMTPIYRLLKHEAASETDPVCRFHAENGVKELDTIMRGELFHLSQDDDDRHPAGLPSLIFLNKER
ncbi:hypothetical protein H310_05446 [Aphanomyces invadans]|uniref:RNA polymerase II assembly factor Rtp1 C-terminal domain-containing protein n=1 Tax=Aphanomyces invadans TaxID=157072 RepID=A0A024U9C1_9STRA|nr:hypothetical protein H310_05446 [Aphanomyces invadans]ETW03011.1 hypothetical protein H310_05446 [Aphanomyces invadans]|eukprot:XP_008868395.1 hypothetical protein H310_05446 [Aphanomyces invadans]